MAQDSSDDLGRQDSLRDRLAERAEVDTAFSGMADDLLYLAETRQLAQEFAASDWEALERAD